MRSISFLIIGDELSDSELKKVSNINKRLNDIGGEVVVYFNFSIVDKFIKSNPGFFCVQSDNRLINPLLKSVLLSKGQWVVFTTYKNLIDHAEKMAEQLKEKADGLAVCARLHSTTVDKLLGRRDITSTGFAAFERQFIRRHFNPNQPVISGLRSADRMAGITFLPNTIFKDYEPYFASRTILVRPIVYIIVQHVKNIAHRAVSSLKRNVASYYRRAAYRYLMLKTPKISFDPMMPVFIICRDRVQPLKTLVKWVEGEGLKNLVFIDNDSSYPPLLEYFKQTPYEVVRLRKNAGQTSPWGYHIIEAYANNKAFIVSDPDVLPADGSHGAVKKFISLLNKYPQYTKAGFGLKIDDLPDHYALKQSVINWETQFWKHEIEKDVFDADTDTTFALYRANTPYVIRPALRTGGRFVARHEPWYIDSDNQPDEVVYYRSRANKSVGTWGVAAGDLAKFYVNHEESLKQQEEYED